MFPRLLPLGLVLLAGCAGPGTVPAPAHGRGAAGDEPAAASGRSDAAPARADSLPTAAKTDDTPADETLFSTAGTSTLGFGILRLAPGPGATSATFRIRYTDWGDGGYSSDGTSACLLVMPGDAFAASDAAYADCWLAFDRVVAVGGGVGVAATVTVDSDRTVLVAYGPWDGADVGRPPSDRHTYELTVEPADRGNWRWVEAEAGEMVTTNWTRRPGVVRGGPVTDPLTGRPLWIETRVLVLYDPVNARSAAGPAEGGESLEGAMPLRPELHDVLSRVPIKWR